MIIPTGQYFNHSYLKGTISLFKTLIKVMSGQFRGNTQFHKLKSSYESREVKNIFPVLELMDAESLKCVSCQLCEKACPTKCIDIVINDKLQFESGTLNFGSAPKDFKIDLRRCIQCGLCEEVCPVGAISMTGEYNLLNFEEQFWNAKMLSKQAKVPKQEF